MTAYIKTTGEKVDVFPDKCVGIERINPISYIKHFVWTEYYTGRHFAEDELNTTDTQEPYTLAADYAAGYIN